MLLRQTCPVRDLYTNVTEPVAQQIIYKFLRDLDMLHIFNNEIVFKSSNSAASSGTDSEGNAKLHENKATVTLTHNLNPNSVKWETNTFRNLIAAGDQFNHIGNNKPLFYDVQSQAVVTEREVPYNIILETELHFKDRVSATEAMNKIFTQYANGEMITVQHLRYDYPLPLEVISQLFGVYKLSGGDESSLDDFLQYLSDYSGGRITSNINRIALGGKRQIMVSRNNLYAVIGIDYTQEQADSEGVGTSTDLFKINFTLTVQFSRCHMLTQAHPIVIYNQMVPKEMLLGVDPDESYRKPDEVHPYFSFDKWLDAQKGLIKKPAEVVKLPWYDPWTVPEYSALGMLEYQEFLQIALTLDSPEDENGTTTINLETDLPFPLIDSIITSLKKSKGNALYFTEQFSVSVYVNNFPIEPSELSLEDGVTLIIPNREIYPVYRLIISEYIGKQNGTLTPFWVGQYDVIAH